MGDVESKVRSGGVPFMPKGEPTNISRSGNSEDPGKQLSSFSKDLKAEKQSTIRQTGKTGTEQAHKGPKPKRM